MRADHVRQGEPRLRRAVAERLNEQEGLSLAPDDIQITSGSLQGIAMLAQLLVDPGDTILLEAPTFMGTVRVFRLLRPRLEELPLDEHGLRVDVLKVPHHGSRHQQIDWLTSLGARLALVSVGEDNGYGHPAPELLHALTAAGMEVRRTDLDGDVLVVAAPVARLRSRRVGQDARRDGRDRRARDRRAHRARVRHRPRAVRDERYRRRAARVAGAGPRHRARRPRLRLAGRQAREVERHRLCARRRDRGDWCGTDEPRRLS